MTPFKKLSLLLLVSGSLTFSMACKKDDPDPVTCNYLEETQDEVDALTAAATAYANDPTPANCLAYKNAAQEYLNELQHYVSCAAQVGQQAELQAAIDSAQASVDSIQC